jgi:hypothetical protein
MKLLRCEETKSKLSWDEVLVKAGDMGHAF